jgi:hypothetical protein
MKQKPKKEKNEPSVNYVALNSRGLFVNLAKSTKSVRGVKE